MKMASASSFETLLLCCKGVCVFVVVVMCVWGGEADVREMKE